VLWRQPLALSPVRRQLDLAHRPFLVDRSESFRQGLRCYAAATQLEERQSSSQTASTASSAAASVLLDVGGMKCGGCSAAVKTILLKQSDVVGAAVNLLTETAVVQVSADPEATALKAAEVLTARGFPSKPRAKDEEGLEAKAAAMLERKNEELNETSVIVHGTRICVPCSFDDLLSRFSVSSRLAGLGT
jgi:copper chaperone CopZ